MTQENGEGPVPLLAGHLVIYEDAIAFRADGAADDQVVVRPVLSLARDHLVQLLTDPGSRGGILGTVLAGGNPMEALKDMGMTPKDALKAMIGRG